VSDILKLSKPRKRGRPRNNSSPKTARADLIIALTVYQLMMWGFPLRPHGNTKGVAEVVAIDAAKLFSRNDNYQKPLSADRIEQIFEAWVKKEDVIRKNARGGWLLNKRWRYTRDSLYESCPDKTMTIENLSLTLMANNGNWPTNRKSIAPSGDMVLAPKAIKVLAPKAIKVLGGWFPKFAKDENIE
jgi:type I restriction-modification system DNA methylase subunit